MRGRTPRWRSLAMGGGAALAALSLATALAWEAIFDAVLDAKLQLTPGSRSFREWIDPSIPVYMEVYMFNWTNADRFPEEKPHLVELGPYRFLQKRTHVNITFQPENSSVGYRTFSQYWFEPNGSNGTLEDTVVTLNLVACGAAYSLRFNPLIMTATAGLLSMTSPYLYVAKTVRELLFQGYEDSFLNMARNLAPKENQPPNMDRIGLFYGRNNSLDTDGYMEVSSGTSTGLPGQALRWNHETHIPQYGGSCSQIAGTAGEFIQRNLTEESTLKMFLPDLCRTLNLEYHHSGTLDDLPYHKYRMTENSFDYSPTLPANPCFCNGPCEWSGVMNVSACKYNSPTFMSLPHFLHADPRLPEHVTGLAPDEEKHSFYLSVEPKFGVPLDVAVRFQYNVYLEPSSYFSLLKNVPRMLFPIMWVDNHVVVNKEVTSELRTARTVLEWGCGVCAGAAFVFALLVVATTCFKSKKTKYSPPKDVEKPKDEAELKLNPL